MFKSGLVVFVSFFLVGCPGPGDRIPSSSPAKVEIVGDKVCITAKTYVGEHIVMAEFLSDTEEKSLRQAVFHPGRNEWAPDQQCLPTFGFVFSPGEHYSVLYSVDKKGADMFRMLESEFTMPEPKPQ